MNLHHMLDWSYGPDGDSSLRRALESGADLSERQGPHEETPLHVATRRRRLAAVEILIDHGAEIDARTAGGKTAYAHAVRRGFDEVADFLRERGASTRLNAADELAVALVHLRLDDAWAILASEPGAARTGNPEEDRLLADLAGRADTGPVELLIGAGADLGAPGLDSGTPLHQAAWFAQPANARLLVDAGAPLDIFEPTHGSSPLGWAVHGSRYSGGAEENQPAYVALTQLFLDAGATLQYPAGDDDGAYLRRLLEDATPAVREVLESRLNLK